jgi:8-oxo-dGTP pyrophosphatase MutT (NUDIX family)
MKADDAVRSETPRKGLKRSAGAVVVHPDHARVLLRRPMPNPGYDDLEWTHAKGRLDGETPEVAALRECCEELGVTGTIVAEIAGWFEGSTTANKYFVVQWTAEAGPFDGETAEVRWATWAEAVELIRRGRNKRSVARDLAVLEEARRAVPDTGS